MRSKRMMMSNAMRFLPESDETTLPDNAYVQALAMLCGQTTCDDCELS